MTMHPSPGALDASTRLCVMGNSHVAALKGGWQEDGAPIPGLAPDFYGCLSDGMASLAYADGQLRPSDPKAAEFFANISGLNDFVTPGDYDAFLLCGMGMFPTVLLRSYANYATPTSNNADAPFMVSPACLVDLLWSEMESSMMFHCARLIRPITAQPVYLFWQAFFSETLFDIDWRREKFAPLLDNGDQDYILAAMAGVEARLRDEGFEVLRQPPETVTQGIMTKAEFSRGSVLFRETLDRPHRDNDVYHMNSAFGRACWNGWAHLAGQAVAQAA